MGLVTDANDLAADAGADATDVPQDSRLFAANLLRASEATVAVSAETTGGEKENAYAEGFTFDFWRPGAAGSQTLAATFSSVQPMNAMGIAAHDLNDNSDSVRAQYSREDVFAIAEDTSPQGFSISRDGLHMYLVGGTNTKIFAYTLTVAWDITTAVYDGAPSDYAVAEDTAPKGCAISSDGLHLFISGNTNQKVFCYTLGTAYDLSTITYDGAPDDIPVTGDTAPRGITISDNGLLLVIAGTTGNTVGHYVFGVAYDGSSVTYNAADDFAVGTEDTDPVGVAITEDGLKLYVLGAQNDKVYAYTYGVAYDGSSLVYDGAPDDLSVAEATPTGLSVSGDGEHLYVAGPTDTDVYAFYLDTANDLGTATSTNWLDAHSAYTVPSSAPVLILFTEVSAKSVRLHLVTAGTPSLGSVFLGCALKMDGATQRNFTPSTLSTNDKHITSVAEGGQFLGRSIINSGTNMNLSVTGLRMEWVRDRWESHVRLIEQYPFFFVLRDVPQLGGIAEDEVFYGWVTSQPGARYNSGVYGIISLSARGIIS